MNVWGGLEKVTAKIIPRRRVDMNFIFEWEKGYLLPSAAREEDFVSNTIEITPLGSGCSFLGSLRVALYTAYILINIGLRARVFYQANQSD